jgi:NADH-quinone oxidoreductase subunit J
MTIQQLVFYFFSSLAIFASCMVVGSKNSVRAVLFLVFTFFCMAALWMLLESEFLAIVLVLVYVGAVMVLFLFVVMMLDIESSKTAHPFVKYWPIGVTIAAGMLLLIILNVGKKQFGLVMVEIPHAQAAGYSNVKALATLLYTDYLLPFEIAGGILLVAMVAAIALTHRAPRTPRGQKPSLQVQVSKNDRLRILKMPTEGESL